MLKKKKKEGIVSSLRFIISGGGTGGHIFPAVAIANAIKERVPDAEFLFVGAEGKMEMEKVPQAGYAIEGLPIAGFQRRLTWKNLVFPFKLAASMSKAKRIIKEFKPDMAIGTGGYASGPALRAAASAGVPIVIQEQNAFPGVTNRILGAKAERVFVAYDNMDEFFDAKKIRVSGNPVRKEVVRIEGKREEALNFFGLDADKPTLLIIGGSLGARSINQAIMAGIDRLVDGGIQILWQTGKTSYNEFKEAAGHLEDKGVKIHEFISRMDLAYAVADVVVSRAGAIAVSELCLVRKPAIFVPFPLAAEDHQTKNAMALVKHGAGIIVKDGEAVTELVGQVLELFSNEDQRTLMSEKMHQLAHQNTADEIALEILRVLEK